MEITITAPACTFSGFGKIAVEVFSRFQEMGVNTWFRPIRIEEDCHGVRVPFPQAIKDRFVEKPLGRELAIVPITWSHLPFAKDSTMFTMYESTKLNYEWTFVLNLFSKVFTPTKWGADVFADSGVTVPIVPIPLGVERSVYNDEIPVERDKSLCVFGTAAFFGPSTIRKNFQVIIDAWNEAFPDIRNVRLLVKTMPCDQISSNGDERIIFSREYMPPSKLGTWYRSLDAFVVTSRCEGWGLMPHEAMACGKPIVGMPVGGMTALIGRERSFPVWGKFAKHFNQYGQNGYDWMIDKRSLVDQMRMVYWSPKEAEKRGKLSCEFAHKLSWDNTANMLLEELLQ